MPNEPILPEDIAPPHVLEHLADLYVMPGAIISAMNYVLHRAVVALVEAGFDQEKVLAALKKMTEHGPKEPREQRE